MNNVGEGSLGNVPQGGDFSDSSKNINNYKRILPLFELWETLQMLQCTLVMNW